jgi:hypothetical protein
MTTTWNGLPSRGVSDLLFDPKLSDSRLGNTVLVVSFISPVPLKTTFGLEKFDIDSNWVGISSLVSSTSESGGFQDQADDLWDWIYQIVYTKPFFTTLWAAVLLPVDGPESEQPHNGEDFISLTNHRLSPEIYRQRFPPTAKCLFSFRNPRTSGEFYDQADALGTFRVRL